MPLFQRPPVTLEEIERSRPVDISPESVGAMEESEWTARVFRGDSAQLTVRAILMGSALGFLLAFTNLYVGLKTGWGLGVALTACIASFTLWPTTCTRKIVEESNVTSVSFDSRVDHGIKSAPVVPLDSAFSYDP